MCTVDNDFEYERRRRRGSCPPCASTTRRRRRRRRPARSASSSSCCSPTPLDFELARKAMDDVLPTLSQVATSSIGATIGDYKPDAKMTRARADQGLPGHVAPGRPDRSARALQAAYTGVWRKACAELVRFFDSPELAGAGTRGYSHLAGAFRLAGRRARLALRSQPLPLRDDRGGEWRSPSPKTSSPRSARGTGFAATAGCGCRCRTEDYDRYDFHTPGTDYDKFHPIVSYGSLRQLRSQHFAHEPSCVAALERFPEDVAPRDCVRQDALPRQPRARGAAGRPRAPEPWRSGELPGALLRRGGVDRAARRRRAAAAV